MISSLLKFGFAVFTAQHLVRRQDTDSWESYWNKLRSSNSLLYVL